MSIRTRATVLASAIGSIALASSIFAPTALAAQHVPTNGAWGVAGAAVTAAPTPPPVAPSSSSSTPPVTTPPAYAAPAVSMNPLPAAGFLFGAAHQTPAGATMAQAALSFESEVGRKLGVHRDYSVWDDAQPSPIVQADVANGRVPALSIMARLKRGGAVPWASIASGAQDAQIIAQARGLKSLGVPIILTFHHEPENDPQNGTPAQYIAAWRHYVAVFRAQGVTNVKFAWIMMASSFTGGVRATQYYPGDDVIDILAVDGYNFYGCAIAKGAPWRSFMQVFQGFRTWATPHNKPVMIAEWGSMEDPQVPGRKAQFIADALQTIKAWPQVKAMEYFDSNVGGCPWYINSTSSSLAAFQAMGRDPYARPGSTPIVTPPQPSAQTGPAQSIGQSSAVLTGSVNVSGVTSSVRFDYGTTTAYGSSVSAGTVSSGSTVTVAAAIAGLNPISTYHFRVVVTNANGTAYGADQTLTTQSIALERPSRNRVMMMGVGSPVVRFTSRGGWIWGHLND